MHHLRLIYILHTPIDTMKICLITNNYLLSMAFAWASERLRRCIINVIGENLLFDLTRMFSRSLARESWCSVALILCNCNYHFHKQCMVVVIAAVLGPCIQCITNNITIEAEWIPTDSDTIIVAALFICLPFFLLFRWCVLSVRACENLDWLRDNSVIFFSFRFGVGFHSRWVYFIRRLHFLYIKLSHNLYAIHSY